MKVFVVGGDTHYVNFIEDVELVSNVENAQLVVFTGGADVTPALYGCKKLSCTYNNPGRDLEEKKIFNKINPNKQVCYGACRGSQFLAVMNGALLVQDVTDHAINRTHSITDCEKIYQITSTHHQMQYPFVLDDKDYDILFKSYNMGSKHYYGDRIEYDKICNNEPEIVLYHKKDKPKCLAVQGHPEMIPNSIVAKMINNLIKGLVDEIK